MRGMDRGVAKRFIEDGHAVCALIERLTQVVIAAVNGHALGGGTEIALACDLVYASESATFGQPEVRLGIIPGFRGTQRLPWAIGKNADREWIYTHHANEAMALCLINRVYEAKRCIDRWIDGSLAKGLERERRAFDRVFAAGDRLEGMRAFLEKRRPVFGKDRDG